MNIWCDMQDQTINHIYDESSALYQRYNDVCSTQTFCYGTFTLLYQRALILILNNCLKSWYQLTNNSVHDFYVLMLHNNDLEFYFSNHISIDPQKSVEDETYLANHAPLVLMSSN